MYKTIIILFILITCLYSETVQQIETTNRNQLVDKSNTVTTKTYTEATGDSSVKQWNQQDWKNQMEQNGALGTGLIGRAQGNASLQGSDIATSGNPNSVNTTSLRTSETFKNLKSIHAFTDGIKNSVLDANLNRSVKELNIIETTKCYIAREMPVRFKCDKTGLIYGAGINSSGKDAKVNCENECFEQMTCVDVNGGNVTTNVNIGEIKLNEGDEKSEKTISINTKLDTLTYNSSVSKGIVYLDIEITLMDGTKQFFTKKSKLETKENKLKIGLNLQSIRFIIYGTDKTAVGSISSGSTTNRVSKYICPSTQDISDKKPGDFAYLCPSGKVVTLSGSSQVFKICEDYGVVGDNVDGTFSSFDTCNSVCRQNFECKLDTTSVSTNSLQNFREGCMEGQTNCNVNTCKSLRASKNQIINENVFDATLEAKPTIISGALVNGAQRPKIVLSEDVDFQTRSKEEWKDGAYRDMVNHGTYRYASKKINEDTESSDAYGMKLMTNSVDTTVQGSATRGLFWINKPRSFDVGENVSFKHYAVLEVVVDGLKYDSFGKQYRVKDKILYVKTSEDDTFKPFAIKRNYAQKANDKVTDTILITAIWEYEYFNTSLKQWYPLSSGSSLEYFKNTVITLDGPYLRLPVVNDYNKLMYSLPGIIRSIDKNGPNETKNYTGDFTGTGQVILGLKLYVKYTNETDISYLSVIDDIESGKWESVYDSTSSIASKQTVVSDTKLAADALTYAKTDQRKGNEDIEIFMYGKENNKTAYTRIKPKTEDLGKKGFVYIFAQ